MRDGGRQIATFSPLALIGTSNMAAIEDHHRRPESTVPLRWHYYMNVSAGVAAMLLALMSGTGILMAIGMGLFGYSLFWFVNATGKEIAIAPVVSLISTAQWIVGPYFAYYHNAVTFKYQMYVDEESYLLFVVPSLFLFIFFVRYFSPIIEISKIRELIFKSMIFSQRNIYYIFVIGIASHIISSNAPPSLKFLLFLISQFTFIASIYMLVLKMQFRWICLSISFFMLIMLSIEFSVFHILLLWSALISSYICAEFRINFFTKLGFFLIGVVLVIHLQAAKAEYRLRVLQDPANANLSILVDTMIENSFLQNSEFYYQQSEWPRLNARLNQGWIISAVMNYVPAAHEFENGETILIAIQDSMLPRFLSDKRSVSVSENFKRYTGLHVAENTSFGISVIGESWVNFGFYGIIFMGFFGTFYAYILRAVVTISRKFPTVIFWIPLIFLQAAKAETETVVVLNHIVKSGALVAMFYLFAYKVLKWRI
jgi:hypothetical protein